MRRDQPDFEYDSAGNLKAKQKYLGPPGRSNQGDSTMRNLMISAIAAFALIATLGAGSAVSGTSPVATLTISDLHQPITIGVAS